MLRAQLNSISNENLALIGAMPNYRMHASPQRVLVRTTIAFGSGRVMLGR
jgi:hypothetical protein